MKFEEVLPAFKEGKMDCDQLLCDDWEVFEEPEPDWEYIIENKCLCWFWENNFEQRILRFLGGLPDDECDKGFFEIENGHFDNCRPVRKNEIEFYEDRKDEEE